MLIAIRLSHERIRILPKLLANFRMVLEIRLQSRMALHKFPIVDQGWIFADLFADLTMIIQETVKIGRFPAFGITILSVGIAVVSTGITILSVGVAILSVGVAILSTSITVLSTGIAILSVGIPISSAGIAVLSVGIAISSASIAVARVVIAVVAVL